MADITGIIYGETSNDRIEAAISWSETVNIATNTGSVTATLFLRSWTGYKTYSNDSDFSITINGSKFNYNNHYFEVGPDENWHQAATYTLNGIAHNADGTKGIAISASGSMAGTSVSSVSCWAMVALYTIPRASTILSPTSTTDVSVNGTNVVSISLNRMVSTYTHTVRIYLGASYASATYKHEITSVATSTSYQIPTSWRLAMPEDNSMTAKIDVLTFDGATQIGSTVNGTFIISVPASVVPTVNSTNAPIAPVQEAAASGFTVYVQGYSRAGVTFVSGSWDSYESPIASYFIEIGGARVTSAPYQTAILNTTGLIPVTVGVIDARGHTGSYTANITVFQYNNPSIIVNTVSGVYGVYRSDDAGDPDENGGYITTNLSSIYSSLNTENSVTYLHGRYKLASASTYGAWTNLTQNGVTTFAGALLSTSSYDLEIQIQDELGKYTPYFFVIPTADVPFNIKKNNKGLTVGKYAETDNLLESAWDLKAPNGEFTSDVSGNSGTFGSLALSTPLSLSSGGLGATTDSGARAILKTYMQTFTSVAQLGLTVGEPTLNEVFSAMPANSKMLCMNSELASGESPALYGEIEIFRSYYQGWSFAVFHGRTSAYGTYKKYLVSPYTSFDTNWISMRDSSTLIPVSGGGTNSSTVFGAQTNLGMRFGKSPSFTAAATAYTDQSVTFGTAYAIGVEPIVTITLVASGTAYNTGGDVNWCVVNGSITNTGFTIRVWNKSASSFTAVFDYVAIS